MSDYICHYNCSYRTSSGYCGYTGGHEACQYRKVVGFDYEKKEFCYEPVGSYEEKYGLIPKGCAEVKLFKNKRDVLFALMPDGTFRELLVDVPNARVYGILGVGSPARADQIEGIEK